MYASLAVAPLMVVTPILQLSLVFRLFLSQLINRDHEVMNAAVLIGAFTAVLGSILQRARRDQHVVPAGGALDPVVKGSTTGVRILGLTSYVVLGVALTESRLGCAAFGESR